MKMHNKLECSVKMCLCQSMESPRITHRRKTCKAFKTSLTISSLSSCTKPMQLLSGYTSNQVRFTDSQHKVHNQGMNIVRVFKTTSHGKNS